MARRRDQVAGLRFSHAEPPPDLLRIQWRPADHPRGFVTVAEVETFLRSRQAWRETHDEPLPSIVAMDRHFISAKNVEPALVQAELDAPRTTLEWSQRPLDHPAPREGQSNGN